MLHLQIASKYNELLSASKRKVRVYLQVNTSGEDSKSGCSPKDVLGLSKFIRESCPALELAGYETKVGKQFF